MLALGSACYMVAISLAQAMIALKGHAYVAMGWSVGVVVFLLATWLSSDDLFERVEIGLLAVVDRVDGHVRPRPAPSPRRSASSPTPTR